MLGIHALSSQTSVGIGIYPTGTETGIGFRSSRNSLVCLDARVTKANFFSKANMSSFLSELSVVFRVVKLEKVRFHIGIGARMEGNVDRLNRYGGVMPIGVEAFPFPFQNAGLFFEVAPFYTVDNRNDFYGGLRTVAGFVFYFPKKTREQPASPN
ncbi:MAG: hypothetical protein ACXVP0_01970 [Bacteroidia bacterium]